MNTVEGFFAVGAIVGPAIVARLLAIGTSWKWLYAIAGSLCVLLILTASIVRYPQSTGSSETVDLKRTVSMMKNPYALNASSEMGHESWLSLWLWLLRQSTGSRSNEPYWPLTRQR